MGRRLRNFVKATSLRLFHAGQRFKVDILPRHFYSSVPDIRALRASQSWRGPRSMVGVAGVDPDAQLALLRQYCPPESHSKLPLTELIAYGTRENGELGFGPTETMVLYSFIAHVKPRRVIQVGAGFSTAIILKAAADAGHKIEITCVDPYPPQYLRRMAASGTIKLIAEPAQEVAAERLADLGDGDLLFIDSTHTVKVGGEVNYLVLEVLPRLRKGCFVHLHDIFFPYDYPRNVFSQPFFPLEGTLLHAYLIENPRCAIRVSLSMLHYGRPTELKQLFSEYSPAGSEQGLEAPPDGHFPSSIYLQMTGD